MFIRFEPCPSSNLALFWKREVFGKSVIIQKSGLQTFSFAAAAAYERILKWNSLRQRRRRRGRRCRRRRRRRRRRFMIPQSQ